MNVLIAKIFIGVTISMAGLAFAVDAYNAPSALPEPPPVTVSFGAYRCVDYHHDYGTVNRLPICVKTG
jgi:hypothetical protein